MSDAQDVNRLIKGRLEKIERLRQEGKQPYANDFRVSHTLGEVRSESDATAPDMNEIPEDPTVYRVAGRVMAINKMGKASFVRVRDRTASEDAPVFQLYVRRDRVGTEAYSAFKQDLDVGDIVGASGPVFRTRRGELSIMVDELRPLSKSVRPLPEKFHGLTDVETRFRQRYVDLIMNLEVREVFRIRARAMRYIRDFLEARDFMEVETPMMQPLAGGAAAKPFKTFHNALSIDLYLRIAPELYLKRLVVGGFERVYELNRNFRNEGMSPKHNPEFTMLEFYQAYATYEDLMELTEEMLSGLCEAVHGTNTTTYGEHELSFARPFQRYTMLESLTAVAGVDAAMVTTLEGLHAVARDRNVGFDPSQPYGKMLLHLFEELVEGQLIQPTFITQYPTVTSPLSRKNDADPEWVDRFEFFAAGSELANGFSELNDPADQRARFEEQVAARAAGDEEAHPIDHDYVRALEYGLPPTAGEGIGIDRVIMLLTNQSTIREVIFFPHMRPEDV